MHIEGFDWETGETVTWTKADMPTMLDMMLRVRASSTMPLFMPPTTIDGRTYMDGGMGTSWGICLDAARRDGFERFFIARTQPRGYRKSSLVLCRAPCSAPLSGTIPWLPSAPSRGHLAITSCATRWSGSSGRLCLRFYPDEMPVDNKETNWEKLCASYDAGYAQAQREAASWEAWIGGR